MIYIENYMALMACLVSEKEISADHAIRVMFQEKTFGWRNKNSKNQESVVLDKEDKKKHNGIEVELEDIVENKIYSFSSGSEAARSIGMNYKMASYYVNTGKAYKNRYIFKKIS